jgi:hypothetical protein
MGTKMDKKTKTKGKRCRGRKTIGCGNETCQLLADCWALREKEIDETIKAYKKLLDRIVAEYCIKAD